MPNRRELVEYDRTTDQIAEAIGADLVIFQTLPDLESSVRQFNSSIKTFDCSVFTGEYITGGVTPEYLSLLEDMRADNMKSKILVGTIGAIEGKGGVSTIAKENAMNGNAKPHDEASPSVGDSSSARANADDTVGLHNSWKVS